MGQEIDSAEFDEADFSEFRTKLERETELLGRYFRDGMLSQRGGVGGYELEAWLVDGRGDPAGRNVAFLEQLASDKVVAELATFNVELNSDPRPLCGVTLARMQTELAENVASARTVAQSIGADLTMIGILPTVGRAHLNLAHMSPLRRYRALNEQVLRLRNGRPIRLHITGDREELRYEHGDVMLESAATSFQVHYKVAPAEGVRIFNASVVASAPILAVAANSPYLFGRELWEETRVPLFEQSVSVGGSESTRRVTFGLDYVSQSLLECFQANLERFPVLLPMNSDEPAEHFAHLRLHNGTIWRWNRPLIGFDDDGTPHLRVEHRVMPAGPSVADTIANAAFYFGLAHCLATQATPPEKEIPFAVAKDNFYAAARHGLDARVRWTGGRMGSVSDLIEQILLPEARDGLKRLGMDTSDSEHFLGIIGERVRRGTNGARWQREFVARYGNDMRALCLAYRENQSSGLPVHQWSI